MCEERPPSLAGRWGCPGWYKPTGLMKTLAAPESDLTLEGSGIQGMNPCAYSGSCIGATGDVQKEMVSRVGKAAAAFTGLTEIWSLKICR